MKKNSLKAPIEAFTIALLILAACAYRVLKGLQPELLPNFTPLMAIAFGGTAFWPNRQTWWIPLAALTASDLFLNWYFLPAAGSVLTWKMLVSYGCYLLAAWWGKSLVQKQNWIFMLAGCAACSIGFYLATNTIAWGVEPLYPRTLAGWWQSNTTGLPGYLPTWVFLRNAVIGDAFFMVLLMLAGNVLRPFGEKNRSASPSSLSTR